MEPSSRPGRRWRELWRGSARGEGRWEEFGEVYKWSQLRVSVNRAPIGSLYRLTWWPRDGNKQASCGRMMRYDERGGVAYGRRRNHKALHETYSRIADRGIDSPIPIVRYDGVLAYTILTTRISALVGVYISRYLLVCL